METHISVGDTPNSRALWPALMEKAYEVATQTHIVISTASMTDTLQNSVYDLNNGYADWGLSAVSGHGTSSFTMDTARLTSGHGTSSFEMDTSRLNTCINTSTYYVTLSTNETVPAGSWFVPSHEYVALASDGNNFSLFNPWNLANYNYGQMFTCTKAELLANCWGFTVGMV